MLLTGKTAVISGAASQRGIGLATARLFAQHGARVAVLDLDEAGARRAAQELGQGHIGIGCNVADRESCGDAARQALDALGTVDILVNNAGAPPEYPASSAGARTAARATARQACRRAGSACQSRGQLACE